VRARCTENWIEGGHATRTVLFVPKVIAQVCHRFEALKYLARLHLIAIAKIGFATAFGK
jgi:hypothetical protein